MSIYAKICANEYSQVVKDSFIGYLSAVSSASVLNSSEYTVFPGFCDVHVHFREPGFLYKETIKTGSMAAARGGYTAVCTMPNLNPVPDSYDNMMIQTEAINKDSVIDVYPYGSITVGQLGKELSDFNTLKNLSVAFSDDGKGVQSRELMTEAMVQAKQCGKIIVAHCEENSLLRGGYIHKGEYARVHNHAGICSESEWKPIERDIELARKTGCAYHVCHISCKESVELIRAAKADGVDVTCETAPHYLILDDSNLQEDGRFKMNPPLRSSSDRNALIEGIIDGTIDMIATDHAPHSAEEKSKGLKESSFGIVGIETAFQLMYSNFVLNNVISLERLVDLISINPRRRFNLDLNGGFTVWNLEEKYRIDSKDFLSMGKATPFENTEVSGVCKLTISGGKPAYIGY